jgi:pseudouridine-5'-phosphate glycosidase
MAGRIVLQPEVLDALHDGRPVVALETAVLTHGLPRTPVAGCAPSNAVDWDDDAPVNLSAVRGMDRAVREAGAIPAVIAVIEGVIHAGLSDDQLEALAAETAAEKASIGNLAMLCAQGATAGTTVSATLALCGLIEYGSIRVFATGGVGGVHPGYAFRPDISADLKQLAASPVCVVCSGAKSILDLPATFEALETLGVPVIGCGTDFFPRFHARGDDRLPLRHRMDEPGAIASVCRAHWDDLHFQSAVLAVNPVPEVDALEDDELDRAVETAETQARNAGIEGWARTPFVLDALGRLTNGGSLRANLALLLDNARAAGDIAVAMTDH